jgi:hypothetical protein
MTYRRFVSGLHARELTAAEACERLADDLVRQATEQRVMARKHREAAERLAQRETAE